MQSTGIVRKLDSLGRITLPMELRKSFDIGEREPLEIFTEEDKIIIKKYNPSDIFTGQCEDLIEYRGKKVSRDSIPATLTGVPCGSIQEIKICLKKPRTSRERQNGQPPPLRKQRRGLFCLFIFSLNTVFVSCCQIYKINYGR